MAIDFLVMPLSRYLAGDFVTPSMRDSWTTGVPYFVFGPGERREFPPDVPYGGPTASSERERFLPMVLDDLRAAPQQVLAQLWDEASNVEPRFHRVDPTSYAALVGDGEPSSHLAAQVFLPCDFTVPFRLDVPVMGALVGSARGALAELEHATEAAGEAASTLRAALDDGLRLRLPVIVDL